MGGTAISALTTVKLYTNVGSRGAVPDHRRRARGVRRAWRGWCCATLPGAPPPTTSLVTRIAANSRLRITWQACILYAVAFGGYVAFSVYLPAYLKTDYGAHAGGRREPDGRLRGRRGPDAPGRRLALGPVRPDPGAGRRRTRVVAVGAGVAATHPLLEHVGTVAFLAMAAALGAGSGATFALIARVTDPARVGGVTGLVGAAGGLGGFVPPLIMGYVYGRTDSYAIGLWMLSVTAVLTLLLTVTVVRRTADRTSEGADRVNADRSHRPRGTGLQRPDRRPELLHQGQGLRGQARPVQGGRSGRRRVLPGPVEPRQGRALDPRRELHRLVLVEGLRQGRDHHLGGAADRLPVDRRRPPGVRAPRLPARRRVLLVHLLADPGALPLRPRRAAGDVPRGEGAQHGDPVARVGLDRRRPGEGAALQERPRQGRPGARDLGRGRRDRRRRPRAHDQQVGPRPGRRLLADPGDVDGQPRLGRPVHAR